MMTDPNSARATVLAIAGSDPSGAAGLQLDLQVFALHAVHGMAIPTTLVVQNTQGVRTVLPVFPSVAGDQLGCLLEDLQPDVVKLGALGSDDVAITIGRLLDTVRAPRVVDPVLLASDGAVLLERRAWGTLMDRIIRGATLVTPNLHEAEALTGERDPERAAERLREAGAAAVLVKGGHASGDPDDFLLDESGGRWLRGQRRTHEPVRGTGCALSSAIAARIARGEPLADAVPAAKTWLEGAIARAFRPGKGSLVLGLEHA